MQTTLKFGLMFVITSYSIHYTKLYDSDKIVANCGTPEKTIVKQTKGDSWGIRKPMHKDTFFGKINLRRIKAVRLVDAIATPQMIVDKDLKLKIKELIAMGYDQKEMSKYFEDNRDIWSDVNTNKIEVYYFTNETSEQFFATRKSIDTSFDKAKIEKSVSDTGIQKILLRHLENKQNSELAFSPEGIEEMNQNIRQLNNGKFHQPIFKVRCYEKADKFAVGHRITSYNVCYTKLLRNRTILELKRKNGETNTT